LQNFYDLLAKIQTDCFMKQYVNSNRITVSDEEMKILEWLHEDIRNEYEHFIPKSYSAPAESLIHAALTCCSLSEKLLFQFGNVIRINKHSGIKESLKNVIAKLNNRISSFSLNNLK